jgi:hypothetical protein
MHVTRPACTLSTRFSIVDQLSTPSAANRCVADDGRLSEGHSRHQFNRLKHNVLRQDDHWCTDYKKLVTRCTTSTEITFLRWLRRTTLEHARQIVAVDNRLSERDSRHEFNKSKDIVLRQHAL